MMMPPFGMAGGPRNPADMPVDTTRREWTWAFDTAFNVAEPGPPDNPTNGVTISLEQTYKNIPFQVISVGSLEIPLTQWSIEEPWCRLRICRGLKWPVRALREASQTAALREACLGVENEWRAVELPLLYNPVREWQWNGELGEMRVETVEPHGLPADLGQRLPTKTDSKEAGHTLTLLLSCMWARLFPEQSRALVKHVFSEPRSDASVHNGSRTASADHWTPGSAAARGAFAREQLPTLSSRTGFGAEGNAGAASATMARRRRTTATPASAHAALSVDAFGSLEMRVDGPRALVLSGAGALDLGLGWRKGKGGALVFERMADAREMWSAVSWYVQDFGLRHFDQSAGRAVLQTTATRNSALHVRLPRGFAELCGHASHLVLPASASATVPWMPRNGETVRLPPGAYQSPDEVRGALERQLQRLRFEPAESPNPSFGWYIVLRTTEGTCLRHPLPRGRFTLDSFVQAFNDSAERESVLMDMCDAGGPLALVLWPRQPSGPQYDVSSFFASGAGFPGVMPGGAQMPMQMPPQMLMQMSAQGGMSGSPFPSAADDGFPPPNGPGGGPGPAPWPGALGAQEVLAHQGERAAAAATPTQRRGGPLLAAFTPGESSVSACRFSFSRRTVDSAAAVSEIDFGYDAVTRTVGQRLGFSARSYPLWAHGGAAEADEDVVFERSPALAVSEIGAGACGGCLADVHVSFEPASKRLVFEDVSPDWFPVAVLIDPAVATADESAWDQVELWSPVGSGFPWPACEGDCVPVLALGPGPVGSFPVLCRALPDTGKNAAQRPPDHLFSRTRTTAPAGDPLGAETWHRATALAPVRNLRLLRSVGNQAQGTQAASAEGRPPAAHGPGKPSQTRGSTAPAWLNARIKAATDSSSHKQAATPRTQTSSLRFFVALAARPLGTARARSVVLLFDPSDDSASNSSSLSRVLGFGRKRCVLSGDRQEALRRAKCNTVSHDTANPGAHLIASDHAADRPVRCRAADELDLGPPFYLLLVIDIGQEHTALIRHANSVSAITNVLAKLILYPPVRVDRMFPMQITLPKATVLNTMRLTLLNPDHSPYRLHGRNWSATFVLNAL